VSGARAAKLGLTAVLAALALGIPIAGCGHTATVGPDRTLRLAVTEYQVVPQKIQVSRGLVTIIVHNVGKLTHNLVITEGDQQIDGTPPIWPGSTQQLLVALGPGTYTMASTLFSDQALGEYGTLTVTH
jgi:hypothetical protein